MTLFEPDSWYLVATVSAVVILVAYPIGTTMTDIPIIEPGPKVAPTSPVPLSRVETPPGIKAKVRYVRLDGTEGVLTLREHTSDRECLVGVNETGRTVTIVREGDAWGEQYDGSVPARARTR